MWSMLWTSMGRCYSPFWTVACNWVLEGQLHYPLSFSIAFFSTMAPRFFVSSLFPYPFHEWRGRGVLDFLGQRPHISVGNGGRGELFKMCAWLVLGALLGVCRIFSNLKPNLFRSRDTAVSLQQGRAQKHAFVSPSVWRQGSCMGPAKEEK